MEEKIVLMEELYFIWMSIFVRPKSTSKGENQSTETLTWVQVGLHRKLNTVNP